MDQLLSVNDLMLELCVCPGKMDDLRFQPKGDTAIEVCTNNEW